MKECKFKECVVDNIFFVVMSLLSVSFLVAGFIAPPFGVIDNSVIVAVGELFGFAALSVVIKAINAGVDAKIKHKDTEIEINNDE